MNIKSLRFFKKTSGPLKPLAPNMEFMYNYLVILLKY